MYIITFKGKPIELYRLQEMETLNNVSGCAMTERCSYLCHRSKQGLIYLYLYYFGFTWRERTKGVECSKVSIV